MLKLHIYKEAWWLQTKNSIDVWLETQQYYVSENSKYKLRIHYLFLTDGIHAIVYTHI